MKQNLFDKPLFQATLGDFAELMKETLSGIPKLEERESLSNKCKRYVYGISGIAKLFGCSKPTAQRIKSSGMINKAVSQIGKTIIVDADLALELTKSVNFKFRKN